MSTYAIVLTAGLVFAALTALASVFVPAPYGRFASRKMGPSVPIRTGWLLMEAPALAVFFALLLTAGSLEPLALVFAAVWAVHYGNRALAFPLLMRPRPDSRMALVVVLSGMAVCTVHAWLYATWITTPGRYTIDWLTDPRFLIGLPLYLLGLGLILTTESLLRGLRRDSARGYVIPHGGGFRWVTSPHYFGEILAWSGLALATWCPGGLFVLTVTLANLVPRARANHRWYRKTFPDYPAARRVLIPFVW